MPAPVYVIRDDVCTPYSYTRLHTAVSQCNSDAMSVHMRTSHNFHTSDRKKLVETGQDTSIFTICRAIIDSPQPTQHESAITDNLSIAIRSTIRPPAYVMCDNPHVAVLVRIDSQFSGDGSDHSRARSSLPYSV
jgi:hypothetical protein